jgi:hypothetical protein
MNTTEITRFFLMRRGRCFEGWTRDKVAKYVLVNAVYRNVFVALDRFGLIGAAAILWPNDAATIKAIAEAGQPQFTWSPTPRDGDSILIADVAGDRRLISQILKQVMAVAAPPAIFQKRIFTYRRGKLVELSWPTILRFCGIASGAATATTAALI